MKDPFQGGQGASGATFNPPGPGQLIPLGERGAQALLELGQRIGGTAAAVITPENVQKALALVGGANSAFLGLTGAGFSFVTATSPVIAPMLSAIPYVGPAASAVWGAVGTVGSVAGPIATAAGAASAGVSGAAAGPPPSSPAVPPANPLVDAAGRPMFPNVRT